MNWLHFIMAYLILVNVVTFFTYGIDKYKAKKGSTRRKQGHRQPYTKLTVEAIEG